MKFIHNTEIAIALVSDDANVATIHTIYQGTKDECQAEAVRLNLLDPRGLFRTVSRPNIIGAKEAAVAYFQSLDDVVKAPFIPVFQAINALTSDADAIKCITAVQVPEELLTVKAEIVRLLSTAPAD